MEGMMQAKWFGLAALLVVSGCNKGGGAKGDTVIVFKAKDGQALAQVGKVTLTVDEMKTDFLERQGQFKGAPNLNTDKARNDYIENQVVQEAMFQEAIAEGYFDRPDVKRDLKKIVVQRLMRDKLESAQTGYEPSDAQIKEHYEKNANLYNREEAVKAAYLSVPFGSNKAKTKEIAVQLHNDAVSKVKNANTKAFSRLAMDYAPKLNGVSNVSIETNETDYLEKAAFDGKFGANAFDAAKAAPTIGQIAPLIVTDNAYIIMMKTGYRKNLNETLEEAKPKIVKRLSYENRGETYKKYLEELKKKYDIKVFKEHLAELSQGVQPPNTAQNAANTAVGGAPASAPASAPGAPAVPGEPEKAAPGSHN
jgi:hypothetical protein